MNLVSSIGKWVAGQTASLVFVLIATPILAAIGTVALQWLSEPTVRGWLIALLWAVTILSLAGVSIVHMRTQARTNAGPEYIPPHILSELEGQRTHFESKIELFGARVDASKLATANPTLTLYLDLYSSALYALIVKATEGQVMVGDQLLAYPPQQDTSNRPQLNYSYRATLVLLQPLNPEAADEISRMAREKKWVEFRFDRLRLVLARADPAISGHIERHFVPLSQTHYVDGSGWPQRKLASSKTS